MKPTIPLFTALILAPLAALHAADAVPAKKPNVLFIAVDDLKPLLGCYGVSWIKSPNIDRLAGRGTVFLANYCQVPLCAPSRASLLTGLRPDSIGLYFNPFKNRNVLRQRLPDVVTLPQYFRDQGYVTGGMGKVFDGRTVDQGHDAVSWSLPFVTRFEFAPCGPGVRGYQRPETQKRLKKGRPGEHVAGPPTESCEVPDDAYLDGAMARNAAATIRQLAQKPQPFFLTVGFIQPHLPFISPKKYWDLYDRGTLSLAAFQGYPTGSPREAQVIPNSGELRDYAGVPPSGPIPEALQRELLHGYAASVSYIDAQVGLLLKALEEAGVEDNTIVCVWGDNGYHLGEHGHWGKSTNYEDATRAPLIVRTPDLGQGVRVTSPTEFLDVYPTLCELAGLPIPAALEGKSLVPVMRDPKTPIHEAAVSQCSTVDSQMSPQLVGGLLDEFAEIESSMGWTLRTPRYRYVEWRQATLNGNERVFGGKVLGAELYDYEKDPLERENLVGKPEYARAVKEHQALFDRLLPHLPRRVSAPAAPAGQGNR